MALIIPLTENSFVPMIPFLKNSTIIMMITENTTFLKPDLKSGTPALSTSRNLSHHSLHAINRNELIKLPVT